MSRHWTDSGRPSRRVFLARLTTIVTAPAVIVACRDTDPAEVPDRARVPDDEISDDGPSPAADDPRPALPGSEPLVRVRVRKVRQPATRIEIGRPGEWIALRTPGDEEAPDRANATSARPGRGPTTVVLHGPVAISQRTGGWSILDARGFRPTVDGMELIELSLAEAADGVDLEVDGHSYPGFVQLVGRGGSGADGYDVVNHVALESYLPGVVAGELYRHWHPSTFAAQAVAARSYACAERSYRGHSHYDLTNTQRSQVYEGTTEHERALESARLTRGVVLAHDGRLVPGYYSACCGGRAANAVDAFGMHPFNDVAPLRGRRPLDVCVKAPLFDWRIERPHDEVVTRLVAYGRRRENEALKNLRRVRAIDVHEVNEHGRPVSYAIASGAGADPVVLGAESLRSAVDYADASLPRPAKRLWSAAMAVTIDGTTVRFDGHGHGHGVGMCQHGAETLARDSKSFEAILEWYYPGVNVVRAYV
ncbi:MAG: SpoIID/LytB domain-containing protein [Planctomycetes bacterium]|nr:SpoIID/LytB domain-containing protein [Planctomycetota bacterium]